MSDLALQWANNHLEGHVLNLEQDFRNGYLLGVLLDKHNQLPSFKHFQDSGSTEAKITNFRLLHSGFHALNIPFDARIACDIMRGHTGAAAAILCQLQMTLERSKKAAAAAADPALLSPQERGCGAHSPTMLPNLPHRLGKPVYDAVSSRHFEDTLRKLMTNAKEENMKHVLSRFGVKGRQHTAQVKQAEQLEQQASQTHLEMLRTAVKRQEDDRRVQGKLAAQQSQQHKRVHKEKLRTQATAVQRFRHKQHQLATTRDLQIESQSVTDFLQGVSTFEKSMLSSAPATGCWNPATTPSAQAAIASPPCAAHKLPSSGGSSSEDVSSDEAQNAVLRDRRRRQFLTAREQACAVQHEQSVAQALQAGMARASVAEQAAGDAMSVIARHTEVMTKNRQFRKRQHHQRACQDATERLQRDQAFLDTAAQVYACELRAQAERLRLCEAACADASARANEKLCRKTLCDVVELALAAAGLREFVTAAAYGADEVAPAEAWTDLKRCFQRGHALPDLRDCGERSEGEEWGSAQRLAFMTEACATAAATEACSASADHLVEGDLADYLGGNSMWAPPLFPQEDQQGSAAAASTTANAGNAAAAEPPPAAAAVAEPATSTSPASRPRPASAQAARSVLSAVPPCYALGEAIIESRIIAEPLPQPPPPPDVPEFPVRVCMCGPTFTGKSEQALRLAQRHGLKVLSCEDELSQAVALAQAALTNADSTAAAAAETGHRHAQRRQLGQVALSHIMRGDEVPDHIYAELLAEAICRMGHETAQNSTSASPDAQPPCMGWVAEDFPENAVQAAALEKLLTGYDAAADPPSRWDRASPLAPCAPPPDTSGELVRSGVDLVVHLDVGDRMALLSRSLGRRADPATGEEYHLGDSARAPPFDDVCKEHLQRRHDPANATPQLAQQVAAHAAHAGALLAFLRRFGTARALRCDGLTAEALFGTLSELVAAVLGRKAGDRALPVEADSAELGGAHDADAVVMAQGAAEVRASTEVISSSSASARGSTAASLRTSDAALAPPPGTSQSPAAAPASAPLPPASVFSAPLASAVAQHWAATEGAFCRAARSAFRELRHQRAAAARHLHRMRRGFCTQLTSADDKQRMLDAYVAAHNALLEDLRFEDAGRAELNLKLEECRAALWADIEGRRAAAAALLQHTREDGWVEKQVALLENCVMLLIQAEVDRFHAGIGLLMDYHAAQLQDSNVEVLLTPLLEEERPARPNAKPDKGSKKASGDDAAAAVPPLRRSAQPPRVVDDYVREAKHRRADEPEETAKGGKSKAKPPGKGKGGAAAEVSVNTVAAACDTALRYAAQWHADTCPIPPPLPTTSGSSSGSSSGGGELPEHPRAPLHRAIWHQAAALEERVARLRGAGERLKSNLTASVAAQHAQLQAWLDARIAAEAAAAEGALAAAACAISRDESITQVWLLRGDVLMVDAGVRLLPAPLPPPVPTVLPQHWSVLNAEQVAAVQAVLASVAAADGSVLLEDFVHAFSGLAMRHDVALPPKWSSLSEEQLEQASDTGPNAVENSCSYLQQVRFSAGSIDDLL
ncbi:hypothetical protein JKP88DRAFT_313477 [Tribonema minus]|uniref:Calponin-homology (CH) domain-containing protein n=1 Tax=Tribonema minus TaxID=303371 RepID=A0A836CIK5_9STRA|nr:hypothetical protein JKP88DRAFT_313477 [Tribonema minus]